MEVMCVKLFREKYDGSKTHRYRTKYKKLSCRRETARCFVPFSISLSLSLSRSFEMTPLSRVCVSPYEYLIGVTLKYGLGIVQGR